MSTVATNAPASQEEWRPIPSLGGLYEASSLGRIRSLPRRTTSGGVLKLAENRMGYRVVTPCVDGVVKTRSVHQLVCEAFHGPRPPGKDLAAHGDGDRTNNRPENLRWATYAENEADKRAHNRNAKGERNPACKLTQQQVDEIRSSTTGLKATAAQFCVSKSLVFMIRKGEVWNDEWNAQRRARRAAPFRIKRRSPPKRGASNGNSKLTDASALAIYLNKDGLKQVELAALYGVSQAVVSKIQLGHCWKHIADRAAALVQS